MRSGHITYNVYSIDSRPHSVEHNSQAKKKQIAVIWDIVWVLFFLFFCSPCYSSDEFEHMYWFGVCAVLGLHESIYINILSPDIEVHVKQTTKLRATAQSTRKFKFSIVSSLEDGKASPSPAPVRKKQQLFWCKPIQVLERDYETPQIRHCNSFVSSSVHLIQQWMGFVG